MILGMLYCLRKRIRFSLYSSDANFAYLKGWTDYFIPFCEESGNILHHWLNRRPNPRFKNRLLRGDDDIFHAGFFGSLYPFSGVERTLKYTEDTGEPYQQIQAEMAGSTKRTYTFMLTANYNPDYEGIVAGSAPYGTNVILSIFT